MAPANAWASTTADRRSGGPEAVVLGGRDTSSNISREHAAQVVHLRRRFGLPRHLAIAVAELAFDAGAGR